MVRELEDALRLKAPLMEKSQSIDVELKTLRVIVYHHAALVKSSKDLRLALDYANMACDTAKDLIREIGFASRVAGSCGLRARLKFVAGDVEDAMKEFSELWEEVSAKGFVNTERKEITQTLANYLVSLFAANNLGKLKEVYRKYRRFLTKIPVYWSLVAGLISINETYFEDFYEVRRKNIVQEAPPPYNIVLQCLEMNGKCTEICQLIEDVDNRTLCYKLIETKENPMLKHLIISTDEGRNRDTLSKLLNDIENPREIIEAAVFIRNPLLSVVEVLKLITEKWLDKAKLVAMHWRDISRSQGLSEIMKLWDELVKCLEKGECGNDCKIALLKLFYIHA